jgi:hypothetical protein
MVKHSFFFKKRRECHLVWSSIVSWASPGRRSGNFVPIPSQPNLTWMGQQWIMVRAAQAPGHLYHQARNSANGGNWLAIDRSIE